VQNARYWVNGQLMQYLCGTNGKQSFMPVVNGQMAGTPMHVEYGAAIFSADAVAAPAPAPAPVPQPPAPVATAPAAPPAPVPLVAPMGEKRGRGRPKKNLTMVDVPNVAVSAPVAHALASGITLFVNAVPNVAFVDLSAYVAEIVEDMRQQFNVSDIRIAPDDSPLAYGKYKGMLASCAREEPPAPGVYAAFTKGSEFTEVVVEALWPFAGPGSARAF